MKQASVKSLAPDNQAFAGDNDPAAVLAADSGDPVPGAGRVDAIRRQDGRWVVVTSKGLIVGR